jgi:hypothetical protein
VASAVTTSGIASPTAGRPCPGAAGRRPAREYAGEPDRPGHTAEPNRRDETVPQIDVQRTDVETFLSRFEVHVDETSFVVTLSAADWERLGARYESPETLVRTSFEFLLERELVSQIFRSFDISQIETYFPEFETEIAARAPERA